MNAALAFLKLLGAPVRAFFNWLWADWRHMLIALLVMSLADQGLRVAPRLRGDIEALQAKGKACQGTVDNLREAARQAEIRQQANLARVDAAHEAINRENASALHAEIEGLRHRAQLLSASASGSVRRSAAAANTGSAHAAGLPGTVSARPGIAEATGDQGFPGGAGTGCTGSMTIDERLTASEQAHQLDKLIDAVIAAAEIGHSPDGEQAERK